MLTLFWNSIRAALVSDPKYVVAPWEASFLAAGPGIWEIKDKRPQLLYVAACHVEGKVPGEHERGRG